MTCDRVQHNIILAQYGELPDELGFQLEQHLNTCEACRREWTAIQILHQELAIDPMLDPSPNLLASSRMRLEEALDAMPPRSLFQRFVGNAFRWQGMLKSAPALATLLLGVGFVGGTGLARYEAAQQPQMPQAVVMSNAQQGAIASVSGIVQTPNSQLVQVKYNRLIPETVQGSLDDPQIRELLMLGTKLSTDNEVHAQSVAMLSDECRAGRHCEEEPQGGATVSTVRGALLASLHSDRNPSVRLKALDGLQPYVAKDQHVRDAVLDAMMHDASPDVRTEAISLLSPVGADASVRQALRTVSTEDVNPAIRNASFQALQNVGEIQ
ncbi:MAG: HEAT repeat domain-containing protein [Acidobacteriaceae bacterium]|nr:HEAT repeat domain-containing protein [Acidobacteriaceae bacterium]